MKRRTLALWGVVLVALVAAATAVYADSAAQIYVSGCGLQYVKHVNDLPAGTTTLDLRNRATIDQQVRVKFGALAEDGTFLTRTIDLKLRSREQRTLWIDWGTPITDLNFIQIYATGRRVNCAN